MQLRHSSSAPSMGTGRSLDTMSSGSGTQPQQLLALARAAADQGDLEVAYLLYAKGSSSSSATASRGASQHQKFVSGQLQTLAAMCQPPTAAAVAVAATVVPDSGNGSSSSGPTFGAPETASGNFKSSTSSAGVMVPKRWQQMQQRLYLDGNSSPDVHVAPAAPPQGSPHVQNSLATSANSSASTSSSSSNFPTTTTSSSSSGASNLQSSSSDPTTARRVFCVSDLHVDRAGGANMAWLKAISSSNFQNDVLIVAGDIADTAAAVNTAFQLLSERFWKVVWVPGNHELWLRGDTRDRMTYPDSWAKLMAMRQMADAAGVDVGPVEVRPGLLVVPLLSWYNTAFDVEDPRPGRYQHDSFCNWGPVPEHDVWQVMVKLNSMTLQLVKQYRQYWQQQQHYHQHQQRQQQHRLLLPPQHQHILEQECDQQQQQDWQQQQQQQQRPGAAGTGGGVGVSWATSGFLAVRSSSGRRLPGLQINLSKHTRHQSLVGAAGAGLATQASVAAAASATAVDPVQAATRLSDTPAGGDAGQAVLMCSTTAGPGNPLPNADSSSSGSGSSSSGGGAVSSRGRTLSPRSTSSGSSCWSLLDAVATSGSDGSHSSSNSSSNSDSPPGSFTVMPHVTPDVTVITVTHFLPHPQLSHSGYQELRKAMGCQELQLQMQQVSSDVHVYGHSHRCADVTLKHTLPAATADANWQCAAQRAASASATTDNIMCTGGSIAAEQQQQQQQQQHSCRYVQYAVDAVGAESAGLYCLWDGQQLCRSGVVLPTS